jgi:proline iminopeptidase
VTAPALVLVGSKDIVTPELFVREIVAGIRGPTLVVLAKSGHMGHLEEPERFAGVVADFVTSHVP